MGTRHGKKAKKRKDKTTRGICGERASEPEANAPRESNGGSFDRQLAPVPNGSSRTMIPLDASNNFKPNRTPETSGSGLFAYRPENPAPSVIPSHPLDIRWPRTVLSFPIFSPPPPTPSHPTSPLTHTRVSHKNTNPHPTASLVRDRLALWRNFFPPPVFA